jgi:hypothetical protein
MPEAFYIEQDGMIAIHTFTNSSEAAVDAWELAVIDLIERTPPDQLFRLLVDVSSPQVSFTRRARQASMSLFTRYRHRRGRLAFLFSSKTAPHFARIFFASLGKLTFEHQYFSSRERALNWLRD